MRADYPIPDRDRPPRWSRVVPIPLAVLAVVVTAPGFGNQFVQDDLPLILRNETIHTLSRPDRFFTTPYWHDPFPPALYRPLATTGLALQWKAGSATPAVYRWVSAALLAGAAIALFELAALILPLAAAAAASALFVVHPVHVESTAMGVNQGELAVALLLCWASAWYIKERNRRNLRPSAVAGIPVLYLAAGLFKENGLVLPGLLLAAELTVIRNPEAWRVRVRRLRPFYLGLGLAAALILAARTAVLGGNVVGTFTANALVGAGLVGRSLTMLGVVPEWTRLLFWPAQLQADYGPNEIVTATGWGVAQWAGLGVLAAGGFILLAARRRLPALAFGLCWMAVALIPVSNVLVPTGITLAERTLFLASAGAALTAGAILSLAWHTGGGKAPSAVRWGAVALVVLLVTLGAWRSRSRVRMWQDQKTLLHQTVADAPKSYGAHLALVRFLEDSGSAVAAASHYRQAAMLKPDLVAQDHALGDRYRAAGLCRPAVRLYRRGLSIVPGDARLRASLLSCLLELADSVSPRPRR